MIAALICRVLGHRWEPMFSGPGVTGHYRDQCCRCGVTRLTGIELR